MKTLFIIHGTGWSPEWNWFLSMKQQLEEKWYQALIPKFPTPENQSLQSWLEVFDEYKKSINEETIFIAHSVWPSFVCALLEELNTTVRACYFVSWFLWNINIPSFDILNDSFVNRNFDWKKIKNNCNYFYMCHGSDDPYVPHENARDLAGKLWIEIDIIERGWHLNEESGYISFEYLLGKIK